MDRGQEPHQSHLFTLRLWPEALGDDQVEWRGQVRHLASGETLYFREWRVLVAFVQDVLSDPAGGLGGLA
ncbi:MAG: hypothetical protein ACK2U9_01840 [Anaerolineae bacterium]|jgi:hypothetical protein